MTSPNETRRTVMIRAWALFKSEFYDRTRTFAQALRYAWEATKEDMAETARIMALRTGGKVHAFRRVTSSALIVSPMTNALRRRGETNVWAKARSESYLVSMVGA